MSPEAGKLPVSSSENPRGRRRALLSAWLSPVLVAVALLLFAPASTSAQTGQSQNEPVTPVLPEPGLPITQPPAIEIPQVSSPGQDSESQVDDLTIGIGGDSPSQSILLIVGLSILSLAPSLVVMLTSFTRIAIVLSLTRNALGLQGVPPNQVIVGLALFLSLFVMAPTFTEINDQALQPYLDGTLTQGEAYEVATGPMQEFMLDNTRAEELDLMMDATPGGRPESINDVGMTTIIPAFVLSELKTAFLMGFVIFIPFLIIDLVVASVLMSLGMMMLPPVFVSLPFKLLLFVLVGGWSLIVEALLASYA